MAEAGQAADTTRDSGRDSCPDRCSAIAGRAVDAQQSDRDSSHGRLKASVGRVDATRCWGGDSCLDQRAVSADRMAETAQRSRGDSSRDHQLDMWRTGPVRLPIAASITISGRTRAGDRPRSIAVRSGPIACQQALFSEPISSSGLLRPLRAGVLRSLTSRRAQAASILEAGTRRRILAAERVSAASTQAEAVIPAGTAAAADITTEMRAAAASRPMEPFRS